MRAHPVAEADHPRFAASSGPAPAPPCPVQRVPEPAAPTRPGQSSAVHDDRLVMRLLSDEIFEHLEKASGLKEHFVQAGFDRQQGVYKRNVFLKQRLLRFMRKANHQMSSHIRDYRCAITDLTALSGTPDHGASLKRLLIAGQGVAAMAREMLGMMQGMRGLDQEIVSAGDFVRPDELLAAGHGSDEVREAGSEFSLDVGHWELDWSSQSVRDSLDLLTSGMDLAIRGLTTPAGAEQRVEVASLAGEQARLREMLGKLK